MQTSRASKFVEHECFKLIMLMLELRFNAARKVEQQECSFIHIYRTHFNNTVNNTRQQLDIFAQTTCVRDTYRKART